MPQKLYYYLFVIIFLTVLAIFWPKGELKAPQAKIQSFEDCVAAGNPVMESYPRQCATKDGRNFVESIILEDR